MLKENKNIILHEVLEVQVEFLIPFKKKQINLH